MTYAPQIIDSTTPVARVFITFGGPQAHGHSLTVAALLSGVRTHRAATVRERLVVIRYGAMWTGARAAAACDLRRSVERSCSTPGRSVIQRVGTAYSNLKVPLLLTSAWMWAQWALATQPENSGIRSRAAPHRAVTWNSIAAIVQTHAIKFRRKGRRRGEAASGAATRLTR